MLVVLTNASMAANKMPMMQCIDAEGLSTAVVVACMLTAVCVDRHDDPDKHSCLCASRLGEQGRRLDDGSMHADSGRVGVMAGTSSFTYFIFYNALAHVGCDKCRVDGDDPDLALERTRDRLCKPVSSIKRLRHSPPSFLSQTPRQMAETNNKAPTHLHQLRAQPFKVCI